MFALNGPTTRAHPTRPSPSFGINNTAWIKFSWVHSGGVLTTDSWRGLGADKWTMARRTLFARVSI